MSRFEEVVNDVIGEVVLGESGFKAEQLAQHVAEQVRERQDAVRAEVTIAARYPEHKPAPLSMIATQEIYTLFGSAIASERGTRRVVGVAAQGMTASPDAQQLIAERSRERLAADGFTDDEIARIFEAMPVATHNQRGLGTLHLGLPEHCVHRRRRGGPPGDRRAVDVERDLRADEALGRGRGGREGPPAPAVRRGLRARGDPRCDRSASTSLRDDAFISSRQENLETIRLHSVVAERSGLVGELRGELAGGRPAAHHTTMREWLDA